MWCYSAIKENKLQKQIATWMIHQQMYYAQKVKEIRLKRLHDSSDMECHPSGKYKTRWTETNQWLPKTRGGDRRLQKDTREIWGGDDETILYLDYMQLHDTVFARN